MLLANMDTTDTLARRLGTTTHVSGLLCRARALGLSSPRALQTLAVQRGCRHYLQGDEPGTPLVSEEQLSNEELAIALLSVALPYDPESVRCGAAMLSAEGNLPERLAWLATLERSVVPVRHVADAGTRYEPTNTFWCELLSKLPAAAAPKPGVLPHSTRFVAMTGFTRSGPGQVTQWLRPAHNRQVAA